jgi:membrane-associated protein
MICLTYEVLFEAIEEFGQLALFFALCLGLIGLPIPNEAVAMTGGALAASGILNPIPAFILTYAGICSGLSVGYILGKYAASRIFKRFNRLKNIQRFISTSEKLSQKYGSYAISISVFLPVLRHVTPYAVGMHQMPYRKFAIFAYSSALLWTLIYFLIGIFVGDHVHAIGSIISRYGLIILALLAAAALIYGLIKWTKAYHNKTSAAEKDQDPPVDS